MPCYEINGLVPAVDPAAFVHPAAVLIGDVIVHAGAYVGPCASLRGDFGRLVVGQGANIQDCCVMHGYPGTDTVAAANAHIGHSAVLHGCYVDENAMIGIGAVLLDDCRIGDSAIVAAASLVPAGRKIPARALALGSPAKVVRELTQADLAWKTQATQAYQDLTQRSLATLKIADSTTDVSAQRKRIEDVLPDLAKMMPKIPNAKSSAEKAED